MAYQSNQIGRRARAWLCHTASASVQDLQLTVLGSACVMAGTMLNVLNGKLSWQQLQVPCGPLPRCDY